MRETLWPGALAAWLGLIASAAAVADQFELTMLPAVDEPSADASWSEMALPSVVSSPGTAPPATTSPEHSVVVPASACSTCGTECTSSSNSPLIHRYQSGINNPCACDFGCLSGVPQMIGDGGGGTSLRINGLVESTLTHPMLGATRLSVADANSPLPTDRLYYSYRHLHNAGGANLHGYFENVDLDQHTLAWENAFLNRAGSLEVRVPIEQRMRSEGFSVIRPDLGFIDPLFSLPDGDARLGELGNISLIAKFLLVEQPTYAISAGLGASLPTGQDVDYQILIDSDVEFRDSPGLTADAEVELDAILNNETVYLTPFVAWVATPRPRWFHQGFLQVDVAANPTPTIINAVGITDFFQDGAPIGSFDYETPFPQRLQYQPRTLLRLNLGGGYVLAEDVLGVRMSRLASIFELHYTGTLGDPKTTNVPFATTFDTGDPARTTLEFGDDPTRGDQVNAAVGLTGQFGGWTFTNGVVVPLREANDRSFDFQYNLQMHWVF
jgi:hypothetical protein